MLVSAAGIETHAYMDEAGYIRLESHSVGRRGEKNQQSNQHMGR